VSRGSSGAAIRGRSPIGDIDITVTTPDGSVTKTVTTGA